MNSPLVLPVTLIIAGVLAFMATTGLLPPALFRLWPVLFVILGIVGLLSLTSEELDTPSSKPAKKAAKSKPAAKKTAASATKKVAAKSTAKTAKKKTAPKKTAAKATKKSTRKSK